MLSWQQCDGLVEGVLLDYIVDPSCSVRKASVLARFASVDWKILGGTSVDEKILGGIAIDEKVYVVGTGRPCCLTIQCPAWCDAGIHTSYRVPWSGSLVLGVFGLGNSNSTRFPGRFVFCPPRASV